MSNLKRIERVLLFLTLLFLPTQLGRHFWPQFSFVYSLPIDYLSPTLYFWDFLVAFLILAGLINRRQINGSALNLFLIFMLSQTISLIGGDGVKIAHGLVRLEQYLFAGLFGVYLAFSKLDEIKTTIFSALTLAILAESVLAILQFLKGATIGFWILGERSFTISTPGIAKFDFYGIEFLRPYASFPHPNVLAGFMVIVVLLMSFLRKSFDPEVLRTEGQESIPIIYGSLIKSGMTRVTIILAATTVLLTVSRTAILVGLLEAFFLLRRKWLVVLTLIILIISPLLYTRYVTLVNFDALSLIRREEQSIIAFRLWLNHPFFGIGLNNFIPAASDQLLAGPNRFLQPVHNIFLLSLAETGILGLLGLLGLIGYPIYRLIKLSPKSYTLSPFLLIWLVTIFLGLFDHYFLTLHQGYRLLFLVWGVSLSRFDKDSVLK